MASNTQKQNVGYFVAAGITAMCIGNMFVARKLRSIPKAPRGFTKHGEPQTMSSGSSSGGGGAKSQAEKEAFARRHREYHQAKAQQQQFKQQVNERIKYRSSGGKAIGVPIQLIKSLETLQLSTTTMPSKDIVKSTYRKYALSSHPGKGYYYNYYYYYYHYYYYYYYYYCYNY